MLMAMIRSMAVMAGYPVLILLPFAIFAALAWFTRSTVTRWVAVLWGLYAVYETLRFFRVLCLGDCHERLDLVVVYPVLALASVVGVFTAVVVGARRALERRA